MTADEFKAIRKRARLSTGELSDFLRLSAPNGKRHVRKIENGDANVSGPVSLIMELLDEGKICP